MTSVLAMHAPDGFLEPAVALVTGVLSVVVIVFGLRVAGRELGDRQIPLAGIAAAFIFAAQMFNFPVAAGTTGHLLGGALAAILLGPWVGMVVVSVVVVVQALLFADGGLTALGYNVLNMAVVTAFGGWAVFRLARRFLPRNSTGVVGASALAAGVSVVLSAAAFSIEWLFGASAPVPFDTVFGAMVGVHVLIGIGEAVLTGLVVGAVMASRPDLVAGAADLDAEQRAQRGKVGMKPFVIGGVLASIVFATVVSQFAVDNPDGLEKVAIDQGFIESGTDHALDSFIFADYATSGVGNETLSLAIAGLFGTVVTLAVGFGLLSASRSGRRAAAI
ncbi:MAG: energy-coupling factor ABC transporter permease [Actinomycetota bacterium]|jgi:cobalt/nickel transport system permease protein|nr:energy-coupling factor ABC transporter permease [Actinomycetota bacterium]MDA3015624.1 energy-coupling factor ABC transporter permease [Actinomycetota bacterium]MDA3027487.1 energy-coupling factor ABC transporter permease [Actinomycetota bacterium]